MYMFHVLHISSNIRAMEFARRAVLDFNVDMSKVSGVTLNTRARLAWNTNCAVSFGYIGQNFQDQRFNLIIPDESCYSLLQSDPHKYHKCMYELRHQMRM